MMKNKLLKVIASLLVISTMLSVTSFAQEGSYDGSQPENTTVSTENGDVTDTELPTDPNIPDTPDNPDTPENPDNPDNPEIPEEKPTFDDLPGDYVVGRMYICTQIVALGHSWIYIESTFDGEMTVGCYTVKPFDSVSVGTFLMSRSDGGGLYYNVERYCANEYGLKGQHWLGMDITKDQLIKVSAEIRNWNYWGLYLNCTFFAAKVWNSVSDRFVMPMMFPIFIKLQTMTKGGNSDIVMQDVEPEDCYKQKKSGDKAYLVVVKEGTLDSRLT